MKIGVLLSGCGVYDGTEVSEAVLVLLALEKAGAHPVCVAPDVNQLHTVNHLTGEEAEGERRSSLMEAARIGRGKVASLSGFWGGDLQGLVIPGGYGAAKNLVGGFMQRGIAREVIPEVRSLLDDLASRHRPLAAVSLGRSVLSAYFGEDLGQEDLRTPASEVVIDEKRRTLFTPGFLTGPRLSEVARGIDALVAALVRMAAPPTPQAR